MEHNISPLPLLSVVIATRNRVPYAISAIQSILEISDPRLELVVQDNSDTRELESYVHENITDSRFCYRYTPPPFSSIDNFNAALELAKGEYLCLIGDDDGINPEIIDAAEWAKTKDIDAIAPRNISHYLWSNTGLSSTFFTKVEGGALSISEFSGKIFEVDAKREVHKLLKNGGVYYLSFHLPKLYHGIVHRRCMEKIKTITGAYFGGLSPDIYSVITIVEVAKKVVFVDYPLTIPGGCPKSISIASHRGKHTGRLQDAPHFRDRKEEYLWCELVPRVYSVETIWADSAMAALRAMARDDLVKELNLPKLAAYCIGGNHSITGPVFRDMIQGMRKMGKSSTIGLIQCAFYLLTGPGAILARRIWNRIQIIVGTKKVARSLDGLDNMVEASHALTRYLKENGYSFSQCVHRGIG